MKIRAFIAAVVLICCAATLAYSEESKAVNRSPFSFIQGFFLGDDYVEYQRNLSRIEDQYREGKIPKEKYLELKSDAEASYKQGQQ